MKLQCSIPLLMLPLLIGCAGSPHRQGGNDPLIGKVVALQTRESLPNVIVSVFQTEWKGNTTAPVCDTRTRKDGGFLCAELRDSEFQPVNFKRHTQYTLKLSLQGYKPYEKTFEFPPLTSPMEFELAVVGALEPSGSRSEGAVLPERVPEPPAN